MGVWTSVSASCDSEIPTCAAERSISALPRHQFLFLALQFQAIRLGGLHRGLGARHVGSRAGDIFLARTFLHQRIASLRPAAASPCALSNFVRA